MNSLLKPRTLSPRRIAANRQNAAKSTGPRTADGKHRSSLNASKHGLRARELANAVRELGEDPADFQRLRKDLTSATEPEDLVESLLVDDLAALWWKKARAERAQAAVHWREIENLERDRLRRILDANREAFVESREDLLESGLRGSKVRPGVIEDIFTALNALLTMVECREWSEDAENACDALYGKKPSWRGLQIRGIFRKLREARETSREVPAAAEGAPDEAEADASQRARSIDEKAGEGLAAELRQLILEEMHDVIEEVELFRLEHYEISPAMRRACLAPGDSRWTLILRQEASLDRQLDRKLKLLLQVKRFRAAEEKITSARREELKKDVKWANEANRLFRAKDRVPKTNPKRSQRQGKTGARIRSAVSSMRWPGPGSAGPARAFRFSAYIPLCGMYEEAPTVPDIERGCPMPAGGVVRMQKSSCILRAEWLAYLIASTKVGL